MAADVRHGAAGAGGGGGQVHDGGAAHPVASLDPPAAHLPRQERGQAHTQPPLTGWPWIGGILLDNSLSLDSN